MGVVPDPVRAVAESLASLRREPIPAAALASAQRLLADSLGVALAGRGCRDVEALFALAADWGGNPECSVLGSALRVPAPVAALVNGTMIQALDFDDTDDASAAHTASTVLAAALSVGESRARSGQELLAAVVAGVELTARLGRASRDNLGFTSSSLYGVFGSAAAAAHLMRLDAEQTRHALGIALSQAAGSTQTALDGPLSKHMQSGFAAKAGVISAALAERGISGIENVFEGKYGFFNLYKGGGHRVEPLLAPWGGEFAVQSLSLKPYPSCRATHGPVEASERLVARRGIRASEIREVRVAVPQPAFTLAGQPFGAGRDPVIAAQFSIPYTVAAALVHGKLSLAHFQPAAIGQEEVQALMKRVSVEVQAGADFTPARVEVTMQGGVTQGETVEILRGSPGRPLDGMELRTKLEDCLAFAPRGCTPLGAEGLMRLACSAADLSVPELLGRLRSGAAMPSAHLAARAAP